MSENAQRPAARRVLRVAVTADDPLRRTGLAAIVWNAGHVISESSDDADVVLADVRAPRSGPPTVTLGGDNDSDQPGVLPGDASAEQIDAAIRAVAAGLVVRSAEAPRPAFDAMTEPDLNLLTPREVEVLAAIGNGLSNKAVARQLGISQHTVKFHVEALLRKLGAASRAEAVHKGLRQRLIEM
jgi:two-component system, NarL family, nitrate/nitrite response regulator NarL